MELVLLYVAIFINCNLVIFCAFLFLEWIGNGSWPDQFLVARAASD